MLAIPSTRRLLRILCALTVLFVSEVLARGGRGGGRGRGRRRNGSGDYGDDGEGGLGIMEIWLISVFGTLAFIFGLIACCACIRKRNRVNPGGVVKVQMVTPMQYGGYGSPAPEPGTSGTGAVQGGVWTIVDPAAPRPVATGKAEPWSGDNPAAPLSEPNHAAPPAGSYVVVMNGQAVQVPVSPPQNPPPYSA